MDINARFIPSRLPLNRPGFSDLRESGQIYVDKTLLIAQIAKDKSPFFLSRPRRFGKTLLLNTFASLFARGLKDFRGLDIEKVWHDTTYKVVRIDFSRMSDFNAQKLNDTLSHLLMQRFGIGNGDVFSKAPVNLPDPGTVLDAIAQNLGNSSTILLIDEYDAPLTHHMCKQEDKEKWEELQRITAVLNSFYACIKEYTDRFRFIFVTGIVRTAHVSIFSGSNFFTDLTLNNRYNTLLGFTQEEIERYFDPYAENAAHVLAMPKNDVYAALAARYDGYKFTLKADSSLFAPVSVLNFFSEPESGFENYWFQTGGTPSLLTNFIKAHEEFNIWEHAKQKYYASRNELGARYELPDIPAKLLLTSAGYFTLKPESGTGAELVFPNSEVSESMLALALSVEGFVLSRETRSLTNALTTFIDNHDLVAIVDLFNRIINEYASSQGLFFQDENTLRDLIVAALPSTPEIIKMRERPYVSGRTDLELITRKTQMVIEFKRTYPESSGGRKKGRDAAASLTEGIEQIRERRYGHAFSELTLFQAVMVIGTKEKQILPDFCCEVHSPRIFASPDDA